MFTRQNTISATFLVIGILLGIVLHNHEALASHKGLWNKIRQDTRRACLEASEFKDPKILEGPLMFTSAVMYRVGGVWPQAHMDGQSGKVYCLHPYPKGKPEIIE